jgi:peptidoglycan/LPS O-acetylase OafA/YrhL
MNLDHRAFDGLSVLRVHDPRARLDFVLAGHSVSLVPARARTLRRSMQQKGKHQKLHSREIVDSDEDQCFRPSAAALLHFRVVSRTGTKDARLDSLTGLRFVAAFAVLADHLTSFIPVVAPYIGSPLGIEGVSFFFILSGFVLTWSHSSRNLRQYALRRFARIYPIYLLAVLGGLAVIAFYARFNATSTIPPQNFSETLRLATMTQMWIPGRLSSGVDGPTWTLSVEFFFYLCFPLLIFGAIRLSRTRRRLLAVALIVGEVAGYVVLRHATMTPMTYWLTIVMPPLRMVEFLLGIFAALEVREGVRVPLSLALLVVGVALWWDWHLPLGHGEVTPLAFGPVLLPLILLIMAAASADLRGRRTGLNSRLLVKLGAWSYALYLFHWLVLYVLERQEWITWPSFMLGHFWRFFLIYAGSTILVAAIVYELIERPVERWIKSRPTARGRADVDPAASSVHAD